MSWIALALIFANVLLPTASPQFSRCGFQRENLESFVYITMQSEIKIILALQQSLSKYLSMEAAAIVPKPRK
jgi:hypothetical protein